MFPFAILRSLFNADDKSLERETLSDSFLEVARVFEPAGRVVLSLLMALKPLDNPILQDMKFQKIYVIFSRRHENYTINFQVQTWENRIHDPNEERNCSFLRQNDLKPIIIFQYNNITSITDSIKLYYSIHLQTSSATVSKEKETTTAIMITMIQHIDEFNFLKQEIRHKHYQLSKVISFLHIKHY